MSAAKDLFTDQRLVRQVVKGVDRAVDQNGGQKQNQCEKVNSGVTMLRNVLHIGDEAGASGGSSPRSSTTSTASKADETANGETPAGTMTSRQNQILWNLFAANLDELLLKMIGCRAGLSVWCTAIMQLVALVYKDQHVHVLQRMLADWLETEISETSEDNESNTSPVQDQDQNGSCASSPALMTSTDGDSSTDGKKSSVVVALAEVDNMSCNADASSSNDSMVDKDETTATATKGQQQTMPAAERAALASQLVQNLTLGVRANTRGGSPATAADVEDDQLQGALDDEMASSSDTGSDKEPPTKRASMTAEDAEKVKEEVKASAVRRTLSASRGKVTARTTSKPDQQQQLARGEKRKHEPGSRSNQSSSGFNSNKEGSNSNQSNNSKGQKGKKNKKKNKSSRSKQADGKSRVSKGTSSPLPKVAKPYRTPTASSNSSMEDNQNQKQQEDKAAATKENVSPVEASKKASGDGTSSSDYGYATGAINAGANVILRQNAAQVR